MTRTHEAWGEVADHLSALALKVKLHAEEELSDEDVKKSCGLDRLVAVVDETFDAMGDAFEDDAVRHDARELARSFRHALDVTVHDAHRRVTS